ncbi:HEPN/Toprim-associated domain-containing protein [Amycolatopsis mediterranei]|uniref:HEPN/Toprim-associated domain-containing protein n=1 Tax=Amycolatopsis mediterranei TaxID=33910 RepID=UPI000AFDEF8A|nr:HEPN/Toprim-associated domain-containing protein [Amycolatopsis mediterranei]UZF75437.1 hypothetical protein ISP_009031 [Amycolatopsis mediterranei]
MSSSAYLLVNQKKVYNYSAVPTKVLALFADLDFIRIEGITTEPRELIFQADAATLRERLAVLGFGDGRIKKAFVDIRDQDLAYKSSYRSSLNWSEDYERDLKKKLDRHMAYLRNLSYGRWKMELAACVSGGLDIQSDTIEDRPWLPEGYIDHLVSLGAICLHLRDDDVLMLDMNPLVEPNHIAAHLDEPIDDRPVTIIVESPSPVIVITEGVFDVYALQSAIDILKPHLKKCVRFLDYEMKHEGSVSSAIRTVRSFAAAGVSNRVVALLDNDSAAHQEVLTLAGIDLPAGYRVLHYPDLEIARAYPTLGPQGRSIMDVNGLAGSIEMYLGSDVLKADGEDFEPVQWTGYQAKIKRYQGEITNKKKVQNIFREKVLVAKKYPTSLGLQDWSGLELILRHLIVALAEI